VTAVQNRGSLSGPAVRALAIEDESAARRTGQRTPLGVTAVQNRGSLSGPAVRALAIEDESAARRTGQRTPLSGPSDEAPPHAGVLCLSARSPAALAALCRAYAARVGTVDWVRLCQGAATREPLPLRCRVAASDDAQARALLEQAAERCAAVVPATPTPVRFVFGDALPFRREETEWVLRAEGSRSVLDRLRPLFEAHGLDLDDGHGAAGRFAILLALAGYLHSLGLRPAAVEGRGGGALAAGVVAGAFTPEAAVAALAGGAVPEPGRPRVPFSTGGGGTAEAMEVLHLGSQLCSLTERLAELWVAGAFDRWVDVVGRPQEPVPLPSYPWQHTDHWVGEDPRLTAVRHWGYAETWVERPAPPSSAHGRSLVVFGDDQPLARELVERLRGLGALVVHVRTAETCALDAGDHTASVRPGRAEDLATLSRSIASTFGRALDTMVHLPGDGDDAAAVAHLLAVGRAADALDCAHWVVTVGAHQPATPAMARVGGVVLGLARGFFFETGAKGGMLDLAPEGAEALDWAEACLSAPAAARWLWRQGALHEARLVPEPLVTRRVPSLDPDAVYLVTGGTGGIGRQVVDRLEARGARHMVITSRRPPSDAVRRWMARATDRGARVDWHQADVSARPDLEAVFAAVARTGRALRGICHVAGVGSTTPVRALGPEDVEPVVAPKVAGAWLLHELSEGAPLDWFVGFSSLSAVLAGRGQAAYSAANNGLDALVRYRRGCGLPGTSVRWGLWAGEGLPDAAEQERITRLGLTPMVGEDALVWLDEAMAAEWGERVVADIDWSRTLAVLDPAGEAPLFEAVRGGSEAAPTDVAPPIGPDQLPEVLLQQVAALTNLEPDRIPKDRSLAQLGLDSLGAHSLKTRLQDLGIFVEMEDLLAGVSVNVLAERATLRAAPPRQASAPRPPQSGGRPPLARPRRLEDASSGTGWFVPLNDAPRARRRLITFPYAGGSPAVFGDWGEVLPDDVELLALQLPARGPRLREAPEHAMEALVPQLVQAYTALDPRPTALLGHCLGALVMYELTHALRAAGVPLPEHLFVSGARPPTAYTEAQLQADIEQYSPSPPLQLPELDDDTLVQALQEMRFAESVDALAVPEIRRLLLPAVRADFTMSNAYRHAPREPLPVPIFAIGGRADGYVPGLHLLAWEKETSAGFAHRYCSGGHYFIAEQRDLWVREILARFGTA
jgi:phthiocerol/phenolphthiocerol synthesis type-I polyketide synthase E